MGNATKKKINIHLLYGFFCAFILIIALIRPIQVLYEKKESFFSSGYHTQYESYRRLYYGSQYVQKKNPGIIPDQALEAFAGGVFLKGINPILIIHDQPPLGRYILSLSILLFDNVNTIMVLLFFLSGVGIFLIARLVLRSTLFALLPLGIFINEPLTLNKFYNSPLLEPIQLPFIFFSLYFFILGVIGKNYKKWFFLTSIMIGFVISIRFFILGALLIFTMILYFVIKRQLNKKFIIFLVSLPIAILILLASYARTIQLGSSILHIFGIQKYIYFYHKAQLSLPFSFWDLLLFNKWHTWWGVKEIISDVQWIVIWPVSFILTLFFSLLGFLKKILVSDEELIIILWIVVYCLFLSLGQTSTRYFPPLLPFVYIISTSVVIKSIFKVQKKYRLI